ncbi:MAG: sialidase family protein [Opitutales bacterium]
MKTLLALPLVVVALQATESVKLKFENLTFIEGSTEWDWWQARSTYAPGTDPIWITTMSETGKRGSHDFHDIYQSISRDGGRNWSRPTAIPSLKRTKQADGYEVVPGDLWPTWHQKSGTVLATGKTFNFAGGKRENRLREKVSYSVMNLKTAAWGPMRFLNMPEKDHGKHVITAANAGCTQRVDLSDGDVLLPVRYWRNPKKHNYTSIVARCGFNGHTLSYKEHGSEMTIPKGRGLYEPSLAKLNGLYFLTMRADHSAFVTRGKDGMHFEPIREWTFDDGKPLGSYNTQQHWVTIGGGLFLVYTRKEADNDHVMRHRAPLFIGQVDPKKLQVMRATERILIPENHATLGNSGICRINDTESWATCGEGLLRLGKRKGQRNKVLFVKITSP